MVANWLRWWWWCWRCSFFAFCLCESVWRCRKPLIRLVINRFNSMLVLTTVYANLTTCYTLLMIIFITHIWKYQSNECVSLFYFPSEGPDGYQSENGSISRRTHPRNFQVNFCPLRHFHPYHHPCVSRGGPPEISRRASWVVPETNVGSTKQMCSYCAPCPNTNFS